MSAPWYQIRLLKILALLGQDNQAYVGAPWNRVRLSPTVSPIPGSYAVGHLSPLSTSELIYPVVLEALRKAETGVDAAYGEHNLQRHRLCMVRRNANGRIFARTRE